MFCEFLVGTFLFTWLCGHYCVIPHNGTVLSSGATMNSSDPCVQYICSKGNLTTRECPQSGSKNCLNDKTMKRPFPDCCAPMACS
uniref:Putative kDa family member n=1 Tax=Rhipicephalus microplus TaxID=6941 RepID=A0A6G5A260_RHIMP